MNISNNTNIKLLMGGSYCGGSEWNKLASEIDKCYKLYFLREGEAEITGSGQHFKLSGPGLYFINGYALESQKCIKKIVVDWIHFQPESVYFGHLLRFTPCVCDLDLNAFQSFTGLFRQFNGFFLNRLDEVTERITGLEIQAFAQMSLAQVFRLIDKNLFESDNAFVRLYPALEMIINRYSEKFSLKQLAEKCFLSPAYFHRLFSRTFQVSPHAYITRMRMEESVRQLVYTSKPVKEIAYAVGFEDDAYFSRTFSKIYGTSPGHFRKNNRKRMP